MRGVGMRDRKRLSGRNFMWNCLFDLETISGYFTLAWSAPPPLTLVWFFLLHSPAAVIRCSLSKDWKGQWTFTTKPTRSKEQRLQKILRSSVLRKDIKMGITGHLQAATNRRSKNDKGNVMNKKNSSNEVWLPGSGGMQGLGCICIYMCWMLWVKQKIRRS